jgi:cation transport regulator ChaC
MAEERRYYFAYGSNMAKGQMASRCPGSQLAGRAHLLAYSFLINERGVASVNPAQGCVTYGLLWRITPADEAALDRWEGVAKGLYLKEVVAVHPNDGSEAVQAFIYVASNNRPGIPRPGYLEKIIPAACESGFPPEYVAELESWMATRRTQR